MGDVKQFNLAHFCEQPRDDWKNLVGCPKAVIQRLVGVRNAGQTLFSAIFRMLAVVATAKGGPAFRGDSSMGCASGRET